MEKQGNEIKQKPVIDKPISIVCIILVAIFVLFMCLKPDATLNAVNTVFDAVTAVMGVPILWFVFIGLFLALYLALSKHGNVKLGEMCIRDRYAAVNSKGVITAKKAGIGKTVKITAKAKDGSGKKAVCKVKIIK